MKVPRSQSHSIKDGFRHYETILLIPPQAETDWDTLEFELLKTYWLRKVGLYEFRTDGYDFLFVLESGSEVSAANAMLATKLGLTSDGYPQRLTFFSEKPDREEKHFRESVFLMELLEKILLDVVLTQDGERV